jgi:hypothetical protein
MTRPDMTLDNTPLIQEVRKPPWRPHALREWCSNVFLLQEQQFIRRCHVVMTMYMKTRFLLRAWPPLWSTGQSSYLQIERSRVPFLVVTDFLRSSGSGMGSLSLVRITEELLEWKSSGSGSRKSWLTAVGIRCADHTTPSIRKSLH